MTLASTSAWERRAAAAAATAAPPLQRQRRSHGLTAAAAGLLLLLSAGAPPLASSQTAAAASSPACYKSSLGFQCMLQVCSSIALHWSVGGEPPSVSTCAYAGGANAGGGTGTAAVLSGLSAAQLDALTVHWALVSTQQTGFVALAFAAVGGQMVPADAVVGFIPDNSNTPSVSPYYIQGFKESSNLVDASVAVSNASVVQQSQQLVACFTRALAAKGQAQVALALDGMPMNFAAGSQHRLSDHQAECAVSVSLRATLDASATSVPVGGNVWAAFESHQGELLAHGWLMVVAWALLVPLGVFVAQFKEQANPWLADKLHLKPTAPWFPLHVTAQSLAVLLFIISLWVIISVNGLEASEWQGLMRAHGGLAITIFILLAVHLILAACRPKPDAPKRALWVLAHRWAARIVYLLIFINLMIGPKLLVRATSSSGSAAAMYVITLLLLAGFAALWFVAWRRRGRYGHASGGGGASGSDDASYSQVIMLGPTSTGARNQI